MARDSMCYAYVLKHPEDGYVTRGGTKEVPAFTHSLGRAILFFYASFAKRALRAYYRETRPYKHLFVVRVRLTVEEFEVLD